MAFFSGGERKGLETFKADGPDWPRTGTSSNGGCFTRCKLTTTSLAYQISSKSYNIYLFLLEVFCNIGNKQTHGYKVGVRVQREPVNLFTSLVVITVILTRCGR